MDIERRCSWCGKTFVAHSYVTRYCSVKCKCNANTSVHLNTLTFGFAY